jgi:hypothetical protein
MVIRLIRIHLTGQQSFARYVSFVRLHEQYSNLDPFGFLCSNFELCTLQGLSEISEVGTSHTMQPPGGTVSY